MQSRNRSQKKGGRRIPKKRAGNARSALTSPVLGTVNAPPQISGTIQVPRPMVIRRKVVEKRTFRSTITLTAGATSFLSQISLYNPFNAYSNLSGTYQASVYPTPAVLTDLYAAFQLYKVYKIQLIFHPLTLASVIPYPITVALDTQGVISNAPANPEDLPNSVRLTPSEPALLGYKVPTPSFLFSESAGNLYGGGWMDTQQSHTAGSDNGTISIYMPTAVATTLYCTIQVLYDVGFKNAN